MSVSISPYLNSRVSSVAFYIDWITSLTVTKFCLVILVFMAVFLCSLCVSLYDSLCVSLYDSLCVSLYDSLWVSLYDSLWVSLYDSLCVSLYDSLCVSLCVC